MPRTGGKGRQVLERGDQLSGLVKEFGNSLEQEPQIHVRLPLPLWECLLSSLIESCAERGIELKQMSAQDLEEVCCDAWKSNVVLTPFFALGGLVISLIAQGVFSEVEQQHWLKTLQVQHDLLKPLLAIEDLLRKENRWPDEVERQGMFAETSPFDA